MVVFISKKRLLLKNYFMFIVMVLPVRLYSIGMALRSKQSVESTLPVRFITPEYVWL